MDNTQKITRYRTTLATLLTLAHQAQNSGPFLSLLGAHLASLLSSIEAEADVWLEPQFGARSSNELHDQIWEMHKAGGVQAHLALVVAEKWARSYGTETGITLGNACSELAWLSAFAMTPPVGDTFAQLVSCLERLDAHNLRYGSMVCSGGVSESEWFTVEQYENLITDILK